jgi:hypothetical protein
MKFQARNVFISIRPKAVAQRKVSAVNIKLDSRFVYKLNKNLHNSLSIYIGEDLEKLAKCEYNGKTYYEGERLDTGRSCYSCYCGKGFENKPFAENKHCHKINCNMELHYYQRMLKGCIPTYWKTDEVKLKYYRNLLKKEVTLEMRKKKTHLFN